MSTSEIYLDEDLVAVIDEIALRVDRTREEVLTEALTQYLERFLDARDGSTPADEAPDPT
ncbi:MAG: hypothetical protein JWM98_3193 [Thermoleophilia bacterium]|nr:hypothetical protein [Thermoleophilia bacterium]